MRGGERRPSERRPGRLDSRRRGPQARPLPVSCGRRELYRSTRGNASPNAWSTSALSPVGENQRHAGRGTAVPAAGVCTLLLSVLFSGGQPLMDRHQQSRAATTAGTRSPTRGGSLAGPEQARLWPAAVTTCRAPRPRRSALNPTRVTALTRPPRCWCSAAQGAQGPGDPGQQPGLARRVRVLDGHIATIRRCRSPRRWRRAVRGVPRRGEPWLPPPSGRTCWLFCGGGALGLGE